MRESAFSKKVITQLKGIPKTYVIRTQAGSIAGIPDLIICCNGLFFAWELKVPPNKPTKLQSYTIEKIREAKGVASVVTPDTLERYLDHMKNIAFTKQENR